MTSTTVIIPTLETERLRLRAPVASDLDPYAAFCASDRSIYVGGPHTREASFSRLCAIVGHWQIRGFGRWIIADKETDAPLGVTGPFLPEDWPGAEIAWSVFADAEGRGIAFEAASAARQYAYDVLGWETAISLCMMENLRSAALAERLGARREADYVHPEFGPMMVWRHPSAASLRAELDG